MKNIADIKIKHTELEGLRPVLETWIKLVTKYSDAFPSEECCYWFNERANVSVLAAAAWKSPGSWLSLEEFSTQKHGDDKIFINGRCDLLITNTINDKSYAIEAKHTTQNIGERCEDRYFKAERKLEAAWKDVSKLHKSEASVRVAACFVIPQLPAVEVNGNDLSEVLDKWVDEMHRRVKADAFAWIFPKTSRNLTAENGRLYPGVCLILRVRTRARRRF